MPAPDRGYVCAPVVYASGRPRNALYALQIVSYAGAMSFSPALFRPFIALRFGLVIAVACLSLLVLSAPAHAASADGVIDAQHPVGTAWSEAPRVAADHSVAVSGGGATATQVRPAGALPFTGVDGSVLALLAAVGAGFVVVGSALVITARPRRSIR